MITFHQSMFNNFWANFLRLLHWTAIQRQISHVTSPRILFTSFCHTPLTSLCPSFDVLYTPSVNLLACSYPHDSSLLQLLVDPWVRTWAASVSSCFSFVACMFGLSFYWWVLGCCAYRFSWQNTFSNWSIWTQCLKARPSLWRLLTYLLTDVQGS